MTNCVRNVGTLNGLRKNRWYHNNKLNGWATDFLSSTGSHSRFKTSYFASKAKDAKKAQKEMGIMTLGLRLSFLLRSALSRRSKRIEQLGSMVVTVTRWRVWTSLRSTQTTAELRQL